MLPAEHSVGESLGGRTSLRLPDTEPEGRQGALRLARSASRGRVGHVGLDEGIRTYTDQVSEAAASDPDTAAYVEELEQRVDDAEEEEIEIRPETRWPWS